MAKNKKTHVEYHRPSGTRAPHTLCGLNLMVLNLNIAKEGEEPKCNACLKILKDKNNRDI